MTDGLALVLVRMGGRPCAIPCDEIVEIVPRVNLDAIPEAPAEVLGVMNLRGRVVPVMDVRARVAGHPMDGSPYQHLVVVLAGERQVGLAVDDVQEVLEVASAEVEAPSELAGGRGPGVVRVGDALVLVLSPKDLLHGSS